MESNTTPNELANEAFDNDAWNDADPREESEENKRNLREIISRDPEYVERRSPDNQAGNRSRSRSPSDRQQRNSRSRSQRDQSPKSQRSYRSQERQERRDRRDVNPETFTQVHVARIDRKVGESDVVDAFGKYGAIKQVTLKTFYAFVEFEDHQAAVDAIQGMNGVDFFGETLTVQQSIPHSRNDRQRKAPTRDDICYKCQGRGHWANECRREPRDRDMRHGDRRPRGRGFGNRGPERSDRYEERRPYAPRDRDDRRSRSPPRYNDRREKRNSRSRDRSPRDERPQYSRYNQAERSSGFRDQRDHRDYRDIRPDFERRGPPMGYPPRGGDRDDFRGPPRDHMRYGGRDGGEPREDFRPRGGDRPGYSRGGPPREYRPRIDSRDGGRPPMRHGGDRDGGFVDSRAEEKSRCMREGLCLICKVKGHMARDCPQNRNNEQGNGNRSGGPYERQNDGGFRD